MAEKDQRLETLRDAVRLLRQMVVPVPAQKEPVIDKILAHARDFADLMSAHTDTVENLQNEIAENAASAMQQMKDWEALAEMLGDMERRIRTPREVYDFAKQIGCVQ